MRTSRNTQSDAVRDRLGAVVRADAPASRFDAPYAESEDDVDALATGTPSWLDSYEPRRSRWSIERFRDARVDSGRPAVFAVIAVIVVALACVVVWWQRPASNPAPQVAAVSEPETTSSTPAAPAEVVVSVVGLVHVNGLVRLPPGSRVADAIAAAGGATEGADVLSLNMAARVADGDQILVGFADPGGGEPVLASGTVSADGQHAESAAPGLVDLNSATEAELDALPGVGPVTAAAIVAWRNTNGPFTDVEQLGEVDGIGPSKLAALRDLVTL